MCGACWTHWVDRDPWCGSCVQLLDEPVSWLAYVASAVLGISLLWLGLARVDQMVVRWGAFVVLALAMLIAAWRLHGRAKSRRAAFSVKERTPDAEPPRAEAPPGYRQGRAPLRVRRLAPPVSGALTAMIVGSTMALAAVVVPSLLQLPRWLEFEVVIAAWWAVWAACFSVLLYRGWRVARDVKSIKGRGRGQPSYSTSSSSRTSKWDWLDAFSGGFDLEGCGVIIALAIAIGLAFLVAELLVPMLLIGAYWLIVRGLATVANDTHRCEGNLGRALLWGVLWSAGYTLPLAGLVFLAHWILRG